ncbi:hypothetical protein [Acetobacter persici]|uniref:hypothetical protein n=1 Tax=Acetobacter persici TaxID=1076596 RepID=UPI0039E8C26C
MEKLFAAVRTMYPEAEVLDVRFHVGNHGSVVPGRDAIDQGFADVIQRDCAISLADLEAERCPHQPEAAA